MGEMINNLSDKNVGIGMEAVNLFIEIHKKMFPDKECYPTEVGGEDDSIRHIDVVANGETHDVKDNMNYDNHGRECIRLEDKNNWGGKGSLHGDEKYLTFKFYKLKLFYSFKREDLENYLEDNWIRVNGKKLHVVKPHNYSYVGYRRYNEGKKDMTVLIPFEDVEHLIYNTYYIE